MASAIALADLVIKETIEAEPTNASVVGDRIYPEAAPEPVAGDPDLARPFVVYRCMPLAGRDTGPIGQGFQITASQLVYEVVWCCLGQSIEPILAALEAGDAALDGLTKHVSGATVGIGRSAELRLPQVIEGGVTFTQQGFRYEVDVVF